MAFSAAVVCMQEVASIDLCCSLQDTAAASTPARQLPASQEARVQVCAQTLTTMITCDVAALCHGAGLLVTHCAWRLPELEHCPGRHEHLSTLLISAKAWISTV